ncbi:MAG TPA: DUF1707 domain-containing protein [Chloroflexota bacterium]
MDASRRLWPRSDLRAGDADRKAIVDELQRHYIEGRLTSEELSERVGHALSARTFGDLAELLTDLPALESPTSPQDAQPSEFNPYGHDQWHPHLSMPPIGLVVLLIGLVLMLMLFTMPGGMRFGFFPWPLLIWGFFIIGRPHGGGRRRW